MDFNGPTICVQDYICAYIDRCKSFDLRDIITKANVFKGIHNVYLPLKSNFRRLARPLVEQMLILLE